MSYTISQTVSMGEDIVLCVVENRDSWNIDYLP